MHFKSISYSSHLAPKPLCSVFIYISVQLPPGVESGFHPASLSLTANILFVCLVCGFICMNTVPHIPATPPSLLFLFSCSHPRLPLISHVFSISPPSFHSLSPPSLAANPLLLPPLHPLLPEGFEKLLHNALQIITMHVLWIWGDTAGNMGFDKE